MLTNLSRRSPAIAAQYAGMAAVWGSSFLLLKIAVGGLSPIQVALGSGLFGAATLAIVMFITKRRWPAGIIVWLKLTLLGALNCVGPTFLFAWGVNYVPSSLESIYEAATPILTLLSALVFIPQERLTMARTVAFVVAAGAIVLIASPWASPLSGNGPSFLWGQLACLGAAACYALGGTYTRHFLAAHSYDGTTVAASQSVASATIMLILAPVTSASPVHFSVPIVLSVLILGVLSAGFGDLWYTNVIQAWGPTVASSAAYFTPVGGVLLGALVLREHIHWYEVVGGAAVLIAVFLSEQRLRKPRRAIVGHP